MLSINGGVCVGGFYAHQIKVKKNKNKNNNFVIIRAFNLKNKRVLSQKLAAASGNDNQALNVITHITFVEAPVTIWAFIWMFV